MHTTCKRLQDHVWRKQGEKHIEGALRRTIEERSRARDVEGRDIGGDIYFNTKTALRQQDDEDD